MKEKFIELLAENGITAEMGMTPVTDVYIMHWTKDNEVRDFWFFETD